ncbi:Guanine deaminase [Phycisphaerae bacterium RAS1]|nr:Guanine deaminase [Phycisphaerae bacterium RAS1]
MTHEHWMGLAIQQARAGVASGQSPFGAVIVRGDALIAGGHNQVWQRCDPTAHAEVVCIQNAAAALRTIDLAACRMYTTCEPCPMCAAAIHWSKLEEVYFGATISDAQQAGFSELIFAASELYRHGGSPVRIASGVLAEPCKALFAEWLARADRRAY